MASLYVYCITHNRTDLLSQWNAHKNKGITPHHLTASSNQKVWWTCERGHEFESPVVNRVYKGKGCPFCSGRSVIPGETDLATREPALAAQWNHRRNNGVTPDSVSPSSYKKVWWVCEKGHEWQSHIVHRTNGNGCPICTNRKIVPGINDLSTTRPDLAAQWHPTKNEDLSPSQVVSGSARKVWWQCEQGHEWQASINKRTTASCPHCSPHSLVPGINDLRTKEPEIAALWHPTKNGDLTPDAVASKSNKIVWWCCEQGHEWKARVYSLTSQKHRCPYCTGQRVLPGFNDLATKHPDVAAQWHPELNEGLTPQMVSPGSNKRVWWQCEHGHSWITAVFARTGSLKTGCPTCSKIRRKKSAKQETET